MPGHEVAHADGAHHAVGEQLLERPVGLEGAVEGRGQGLLQEQQVEPVDAELPGALVEGAQRRVLAVVGDPDLRLDEHLGADESAAPDTLADLALVGVGRRGVDETVPGGDRGLDGADRLLRGALEDAESQGRDLDPVVQLDERIPSGHSLSPLVLLHLVRISTYRFVSFVAVFFILLFTFDYKGFGIGDGKTRLANYCIILQKLCAWRDAKWPRGSIKL